jgi:predicted GNAT family acetyltransferase
MYITRFRDPRLFLQRTESFLLRAEAENNLMLSVGELSKSSCDDAYLAAVIDGEDVVACAMRTPPHKAVVTRAVRPAMECLVADVAARYPDLPEVFGPEPDVADFAAVWTRRTGVPSMPGRKERLFEIREKPRLDVWPAGQLRLAEERDLPALIAWSTAFIAESLPGDPRDPEKHAIGRLASRSLFVWEDERPVSMAGWAGRTPRGVRVTFVYTPPEYRTRGYATACVARLTQHLFDEGRIFCCLYTDVANRVSNIVYQKIGYRPISEVSDYILNVRKAEGIR